MPKTMTDDEVFESLNEWDTLIREKGAKRDQIVDALSTLSDIVRDEDGEEFWP